MHNCFFYYYYYQTMDYVLWCTLPNGHIVWCEITANWLLFLDKYMRSWNIFNGGSCLFFFFFLTKIYQIPSVERIGKRSFTCKIISLKRYLCLDIICKSFEFTFNIFNEFAYFCYFWVFCDSKEIPPFSGWKANTWQTVITACTQL